MVALRMIMRHELVQSSVERAFAEQDELGKALLLNGANPTLGERVQIRAPWRTWQTINAAGSQHVIKFRRELRIAVMDQAAMVAEPAGCLVDRIAGHLNHPRL